MNSFTKNLEALAQPIRDRVATGGRSHTIVSALEQDIALVVDHIQGLRTLNHTLLRSLLRVECYIDTEIIQREPREPVYIDERLAERDRLRNKLQKLEEERRRHAMTYHEKMQELHDRLLSLLQRHAHLQPGNGYRKDRPQA